MKEIGVSMAPLAPPFHHLGMPVPWYSEIGDVLNLRGKVDFHQPLLQFHRLLDMVLNRGMKGTRSMPFLFKTPEKDCGKYATTL